jgi:hypothetical protein
MFHRRSFDRMLVMSGTLFLGDMQLSPPILYPNHPIRHLVNTTSVVGLVGPSRPPTGPCRFLSSIL